MKILALIPLLLIGASVQAATIEIGTPSYIRPVGDKLYYFPADGTAPRVAWPGMENNARDINVPTTKGRLPVTINQKTPVSINNLGKAAVNLAKRAGPLGIGLTLAWELCDKTDICASPSDPANPASTPVFSLTHPDSKPMSYQRWRVQAQPAIGVAQSDFSTYTAACEYYVPKYFAAQPWVETQMIACLQTGSQNASADIQFKTSPTANISQTRIGVAFMVQNCPSTHYLSNNMCQPNDPNKRTPVTPGAWDGAEGVPGLNDPGIIPDLIEGGEPIPLDTPTIDPKTVPGPGGATTETVRNGQGEPIGTKTTDTTVTVSPSGPTTVEVTETTTITETNITNNTTTVTTQETTLPNSEDQSEKPKEDTDIEIDDVQDKDLETYEVPDTFTYDSWGGGSCPGDPAVSVLGKSLVIPVHTVCDGLTMLRPVVLIIAALASAFIIVGAVKE